MNVSHPSAAPNRSSLAGPLCFVLLFAALMVFGETITGRTGLSLDANEKSLLGYVVGVGFWMSAANAATRFLFVLVWTPMASGPKVRGAPQLLVDLVTFTTYALAITMIVGSVFGRSLTGFWATSGVLGLVLGFALRNLILDLFTGIAVNVEQPYRIGDWVETRSRDCASVGRVVEMNWRTTRLATEAGDIVVIPNGMLATLVVTNRGAVAQRMRDEVSVTLDFSIATERARRILQAAAVQATDGPGFCNDPAPRVLVGAVGPDGIEYLVRYWTTVWKQLSPSGARDVVTSAIVEHLRQAGLAPGHSKEDLFFAPMPSRQIDSLSDADCAELLSRVELFRALDENDLALLATGVHRVTVHAGTALLNVGDPGESMFIVVEGVLDVLVSDPDGGAPRRVSRIGPGEVIGEMTLLTGEPRSATISAVTDVLAYEMTRGPVTALFARRPEVAERISEVVARRLAARQATLAAQETGREDAREITAGQLLSRIKAVFRSAWRGKET
jgi:small-conductance mechanosensitive channel/CRP-like cAMP-binding protein